MLATGLLAAVGAAHAGDNPVDPVSNPQGLEFPDVEMEIPEYAAPFQRTGRLVTDAELFRQVVPGMPAARVQSLLGKPLNHTSDGLGKEWNYNFTLLMPVSRNHLVCQYKVVFDSQQRVEDAVWRRDQCLDIVNQAAAG